jgi:hypothetical protein
MGGPLSAAPDPDQRWLVSSNGVQRFPASSRAGESSRMLFAGPRYGWSFCGDLGHRQSAHLQSTAQHQADHGKGADQHADRDQLACALTHRITPRITKARRWKRRAPGQPKEKRCRYTSIRPYKRARQKAQDALFRGRPDPEWLGGWQRVARLRRRYPERYPGLRGVASASARLGRSPHAAASSLSCASARCSAGRAASRLV